MQNWRWQKDVAIQASVRRDDDGNLVCSNCQHFPVTLESWLSFLFLFQLVKYISKSLAQVKNSNLGARRLAYPVSLAAAFNGCWINIIEPKASQNRHGQMPSSEVGESWKVIRDEPHSTELWGSNQATSTLTLKGRTTSRQDIVAIKAEKERDGHRELQGPGNTRGDRPRQLRLGFVNSASLNETKDPWYRSQALHCRGASQHFHLKLFVLNFVITFV